MSVWVERFLCEDKAGYIMLGVILLFVLVHCEDKIH